MKILVAEDDKFYGQNLCEVLSDHGVKACLVSTVQDALTMSLDEVDAAVIDVMLANNPEESGISMEETRGGYLSGVALARRFKQSKPGLPVILFSAAIAGDEATSWARDNAVPFVLKEDGRRALIQTLGNLGLLRESHPKTFVVHGHDEKALLELKDYIQNTLKWDEPIVLREQANVGRTIIEKFEEYSSRIDHVFVLMTPDDITIGSESTDDEKRRARQNVIFELGFFYGQFGRRSGRIIVFHKGDVELPSDMQGIVWIKIDGGVKKAGEQIRKELGLS